MSHATFGLLAAAILAAGPTLAEAEGRAAPGATVSGVVVEAPRLPDKECHERDRACIVTVVAELKRRYPKELKQFCFQREMRDIRNGTPIFGSEHTGSVALKIACAKDKTP